MVPYLVVALGSALGGALRHAVVVSFVGTGWPYGTLVVNVVGSFAIGAIVAYSASHGHWGQRWLLFLITGVLGGFTTFSAFSLDAFLLFQRGRLAQAALYVGASVGLSIAALVLAVGLVRRIA